MAMGTLNERLPRFSEHPSLKVIGIECMFFESLNVNLSSYLPYYISWF